MTESNPPPPPADNTLNYAAMTAKNAYTGPAPTQDDRNMTMIMYILAIPTGFIGPLIIWLMKKENSPFIDDQGKEVLNFQITLTLAFIVCFILAFVIIGFFLMPVVILCNLVFLIIGALKAKDGIAYRFPFAIRLLK